jgi:hypothetical protein
MRVADGRVVRRIPSADPREHFLSAPATACGSHDVPPTAASVKAVAGPSLLVSMQLGRAGGHLPQPRCAPPFLHASERCRVQASHARPGRLPQPLFTTSLGGRASERELGGGEDARIQ